MSIESRQQGITHNINIYALRDISIFGYITQLLQ